MGRRIYKSKEFLRTFMLKKVKIKYFITGKHFLLQDIYQLPSAQLFTMFIRRVI